MNYKKNTDMNILLTKMFQIANNKGEKVKMKYIIFYQDKNGNITESVIDKKENFINIVNYLGKTEGKIIDLKWEEQ